MFMLKLKLFFCCLVALGMAVTASAQSRIGNDLPAGSGQAKARTACTICHDSHIIVQQRLSKAAWGKEVDKMIKWGAIVSPSDRDALIDYFSANFGPEKTPYIAARSARSKH
jgi:hypothetical protein